MYKTEELIYRHLSKLKTNFNLQGIKAEFEAEGSSFRDLVRLRRITATLDIKLYLKIGGAEAVRDMKDSLEIGVDGIIAPMIESKFGVKKFVDAYRLCYQDYNIQTTVNIETRSAVENIEDIINYSSGKINSIVIGRSDLAASFFDKNINQESPIIYELIEKVGLLAKSNNISLTVGGGVSVRTIKNLRNLYPDLVNLISKLETRKVMFLTEDFLRYDELVTEALNFEALYILSKKEYSEMYISSEISRLTELKRRT